MEYIFLFFIFTAFLILVSVSVNKLLRAFHVASQGK